MGCSIRMVLCNGGTSSENLLGWGSCGQKPYLTATYWDCCWQRWSATSRMMWSMTAAHRAAGWAEQWHTSQQEHGFLTPPIALLRKLLTVPYKTLHAANAQYMPILGWMLSSPSLWRNINFSAFLLVWDFFSQGTNLWLNTGLPATVRAIQKIRKWKSL